MNETTKKSKGMGEASDRLVTRELLERISTEASELGSDEMHSSVSFLLTTNAQIGELGHGAAALHALTEGATTWVRNIDNETDPKPPAGPNPARLRELLLALANNLAITNDLVDAMLGALPPDGAA